MPTIDVPDDTYQHLLAQAALRHTTVERLAAEFLGRPALDAQPAPPATAEEWVADLKAWVSTLPRRPATVDDSRDSIYDDRGR